MGKFQQDQARKRAEKLREFLLSYFPRKSGEAHREVNGYVLRKLDVNGLWTVAIYTRESWQRYQAYLRHTSEGKHGEVIV